MAPPIRELLHMVAPFSFVVEGEGTGKPIERLVLKGFASVESVDRAGDITDPREFQIDEFMAAPTLLINHKFWFDDLGNAMAAGRVLTMHAVRISNIGSDTEWGIVDIKTRKQINTYLKARVPSLRKGTKGLFITAEITNPDIRGQVARGELSGLSWKGLATLETELDPKLKVSRRRLSNIDIYEISVVHVPEHSSSTFIVGKMNDGIFEQDEDITLTDMQLWQVILSKSTFPSQATAVEYLKAHGLEYDRMKDDDDSYFALQQPSEGLDIGRTVRVKMGSVFMLTAPPKEALTKSVQPGQLVAESVKGSDYEQETDTMSDNNDQTDTKKTDTSDTSNPDTKVIEKATFPSVEEISVQVASAVSKQLSEPLTGIGESMKAVGDGLATLTEVVSKMATGIIEANTNTDTDTKTDTKTKTDEEKDKGDVSTGNVSKSIDTSGGVDLDKLMDTLNGVAKGLADTQKTVAEVAKSVVAVGKGIPNAGITRDENIQQQTQKSDNPNSCLDSIFPF